MNSTSAPDLTRFYYSVVRVVPDPIRDEAVNIGIIVTPAEGLGGRMQLASRPATRVRKIHPSYSFDALDRSLRDLAAALGTDTQAELGEPRRLAAGHELLEITAARLNGQVQLTKPQAYLATSADAAVDKLFRRYVAKRPGVRPWLPGPTEFGARARRGEAALSNAQAAGNGDRAAARDRAGDARGRGQEGAP